VVTLERIRAALAAGVAAWREETDPEEAETYADTAAALESTLREATDPDDASDRFALAAGLYTFSARFHTGQRCPLYLALGVLSDAPIGFRPGLGNMEEGDRAIFELLRGIRKGDGHGAACDFAERAAVVLAILCTEEGEA
jgi:hypothetical protein